MTANICRPILTRYNWAVTYTHPTQEEHRLRGDLLDEDGDVGDDTANHDDVIHGGGRHLDESGTPQYLLSTSLPILGVTS